MVIDSSEMFADFTTVLAAVADFAGLPEHSLKYDSSREYRGCNVHGRRHGNDYFGPGGRFAH